MKSSTSRLLSRIFDPKTFRLTYGKPPVFSSSVEEDDLAIRKLLKKDIEDSKLLAHIFSKPLDIQGTFTSLMRYSQGFRGYSLLFPASCGLQPRTHNQIQNHVVEKTYPTQGNKIFGRGSHRGSMFRKFLRNAIGQKSSGLMHDSWGQGQTAPKAIRDNEHPHEVRVSGYLADMTLLFVSIPDASVPDSMRGIIESNAIALLIGCRESSPDKPGSNRLVKS